MPTIAVHCENCHHFYEYLLFEKNEDCIKNVIEILREFPVIVCKKTKENTFIRILCKIIWKI